MACRGKDNEIRYLSETDDRKRNKVSGVCIPVDRRYMTCYVRKNVKQALKLKQFLRAQIRRVTSKKKAAAARAKPAPSMKKALDTSTNFIPFCFAARRLLPVA